MVDRSSGKDAVRFELPLGYLVHSMGEDDPRNVFLKRIFGDFQSITFHTLMTGGRTTQISITRTGRAGAVTDEGTYGGWYKSRHALLHGGTVTFMGYDPASNTVGVIFIGK